MNKVYIISKRVKNHNLYTDGIVIMEDDFSPTRPFFFDHPNILPESIDYVYTKGVLEDNSYSRYILKVIDWMLKPGGIFEFNYFHLSFCGCNSYLRSEDEIAFQISYTFKDRIELLNKPSMTKGKPTHRRYKKTAGCLTYLDTIEKWTFGIVSDGRKNERILEIVNQISNLEIPYFEVLICGPEPSSELPQYVRVLSDKEFYRDTRIPLCKKKNKIISEAKYENLVIIHDRISFDGRWYSTIKQNGNYFDAIIPAIKDENNKELHVIDSAEAFNDAFRLFPSTKNKSKWTPNLYMDGSIIIIKKSIVQKIGLLSDYLHWGEKEDFDFSRKLTDYGYFISLFHNVVCYTMTYSKKGQNIPKTHFKRFFSNVRIYIGWKVQLIHQRKLFRQYLRSEMYE